MDPRAMQTLAYNYITPIGYNESSRCGYCEGRRGLGYSYYAYSESMTATFYQKLVDRCWRRSGQLLYRPNQRGSCCPHYTLRLDSQQFHPNKDQRQTINRFNKFIIGDEYTRQAVKRYPKSREEARKRNTEFDLVQRIHESEAENLQTPPEPAHKLEVTLEPDDFTEEKYLVFENYQRNVHKELPDDISPQGFRRFLCSSPLKREITTAPDGTQKKLGSYHQMYRLDGKLVAIGVLDLLPDCISAVYFLYDESVHRHGMGKLGALREIALAIEGGYKWWYPGFYIHSCPKMRYKIDYSPQYVLDPETLQWDLLDKEALAIFDKKDYVSLSRERQAENNQLPGLGSDGLSDQANGVGSESTMVDSRFDLFSANMPGIPSREVMKAVNLDDLRLRLQANGDTFRTSDLVGWTEQSSNMKGLRASITEFAAAIGPELLTEICLDFSRAR